MHQTQSSNPSLKSRHKLAQYDNARFAIFLGVVTDGTPVYGTAHFQRDDALGNTLRIPLRDAGPGSPEIIVSEKELEGVAITRDYRHGADYCLILASEWQDNRSTD
jgi:hypothetical protein